MDLPALAAQGFGADDSSEPVAVVQELAVTGLLVSAASVVGLTKSRAESVRPAVTS